MANFEPNSAGKRCVLVRRIVVGAALGVLGLGLASILYTVLRPAVLRREVVVTTAVCPAEARARAVAFLERNRALFPNLRYLTIIDYTRPSFERRLHLIDLKANRTQSYLVAHGLNSGGIYASEFSNEPGSRKSCLGFFLTGAPYQGRNGETLSLTGLEKGQNDNATARAIVLHGAAYVSEETVEANRGRLGRSWGCPAVPVEAAASIIEKIKGGSLLYIHGG